jgi:hypothetical protein
MSKTEKVLNVHTGKLENCNVGAGCQRHAHKINSLNNDLVSSVASSIESNSYVTEIEKEFHSGNDFGGLLKEVPVKVRETGEVKNMVVVNAQLGGQAIGLDEGDTTFVQIDSHEARFMDMDKKTAAMGYTLFKDAFTANSEIYLNYTLYGTNGDQNIYKVERFFN